MAVPQIADVSSAHQIDFLVLATKQLRVGIKPGVLSGFETIGQSDTIRPDVDLRAFWHEPSEAIAPLA